MPVIVNTKINMVARLDEFVVSVVFYPFMEILASLIKEVSIV